MTAIPKTAAAIQLIGPDKLTYNPEKEVFSPQSHQILCKVSVIGLCFSDLKLLKQFSGHVRKSGVISGVDPEILAGLPSYVPADQPTVPGHEVVVKIVAVGGDVSCVKIGERFVMQADWRWLKTKESNGAFGYNFEGGLQEYVLLDERLLISPDGDSMLLPAPPGDKSASAFAMVEPWACVEESYQSAERQGLKPDGNLLVVSDICAGPTVREGFFAKHGQPGDTVRICRDAGGDGLLEKLHELPDNHFDDIIYFGNRADTLEGIFSKAARKCLINIALCEGAFDRDVEVPLGDIHYRGIRITGTTGEDPARGYAAIPKTSELRSGDSVHVVGAGGPMGVMHVIRNICRGIDNIEIFATDLSEDRLTALSRLAEPEAERHGVKYRAFLLPEEKPQGPFSYSVIMAPIPALCAQAVVNSAPNAIINIFAGIPIGKNGAIDMNICISRQVYFMGTSGSVMEDMKIILRNVEAGRLDTNVSVAAITGLNGAIDGLHAVEKQSIDGKILVYPDCKGVTLTTLPELETRMPQVYEKLLNGVWTKAAEDTLLELCRGA